VILSDRSINEAVASGRLGIDPFDPKLVQPSSVDVRLDNMFLVFRNTKRAFIDVKQPADDLMEMIEVGVDEPMFLHPHEFVLGSTIERVRMPDDLVGRLEGRSSLGRLGVVIHSTAGFIDASFEGHVTLEISNLANLPIALYPGMRIGQISFSLMTTPAERPYGAARGSKYSGQQLPTASRLYLDFRQ
jgi:dCTP deaminase